MLRDKPAKFIFESADFAHAPDCANFFLFRYIIRRGGAWKAKAAEIGTKQIVFGNRRGSRLRGEKRNMK